MYKPKKMIALFLSLLTVFSLAGCASDGTSEAAEKTASVHENAE